MISSLSSRKFEFGQGYIIDHIDQLLLEMAYETFSPEEKFQITMRTLPNEVRGYVVSRGVNTVEEVKNFCQVIYLPTVQRISNSKEKKTEKPSRKVMAVECESGSENEVGSSLDGHDDDTLVRAVNYLNKLRNPKSVPRRTGKSLESRSKPASDSKRDSKSESKIESKSEPVLKSNKAEVTIDMTKVEGTLAVICFNCRLFGHSHETCPAPRLQAFYYKCGWPGAYTSSCANCNSNNEQKN